MMDKFKLILTLAAFHTRSRYRKTWAGFIWVIANPIITFVIQAFIFRSILKLTIVDYPFFLLTGLMPWFFISQSFNSITSCLVNARDMLLGVRIHPVLISGVQVFDQFFNFLVAFLILMVSLLLMGYLHLSWFQLLLMIPSVLVLFGFVFSSILLLSFWHVFYRDIQFVVQFLMGLTFFITPIFYSEGLIPIHYRWILTINPFVPFIKLFQDSLYQLDLGSWMFYFIKSLFIVVLISCLSMISLKKKLRDFYINV